MVREPEAEQQLPVAMPPKKRGATSAAGDGGAKRPKVKKDGESEEPAIAHPEVGVAEEQPQAASAQEAIEAAQATGKGKRQRKPSAKQAAAAAAALEEAAEQHTAEAPAAAAEVAPLGADQPADSAAAEAPLPAEQPQAAFAAAEAPAADVPDDLAAAAAAGAPLAEQQAAQQPIQAGSADALAPPEDAIDASALRQQQLEQQQQHQLAEAEQQQQQQLYVQQQQAAAEEAAQAAAQAEQEEAARVLEAVTMGSAINCGVALVVADEHNREHHHELVDVQVWADATVSDLKRRIEHTNFHGQQFAAAQQDLQMLAPDGNSVIPLEDTVQMQDATWEPARLAEHYGLAVGQNNRYTIYLRIRAGQYLEGQYAQGGEANASSQDVELNPDGSEKKKRRHNKKWNEEETINLIRGVEILGVGHWRQINRQKEFELGHRTDVDLKDKWRNITKAVGQQKKMRGVPLSDDLRIRVQNCMRIQEEKKLQKAAAAGGGDPAAAMQLQATDATAAAAAQQAVAEDDTVQGVLAGALQPSQVQQYAQGDAGGLEPNQHPNQHFQAQLQAADPAAMVQQEQYLQQAQQDPATLGQQDPATLQQQQELSAVPQQDSAGAPPQLEGGAAALLQQQQAAAAEAAAEQQAQQQQNVGLPQVQQQQPGDIDPGTVVLPGFEEEGQAATSELPVAPLNII